MADIYLQIGTSATVEPTLGYGILGVNIGVTQVTQSIVIYPEKPFLYYNSRFLSALNIGVISQSVYDIIIAEQSEVKQVYEVNDNLDINKQILIDLVTNNNIDNIELGGTTAEIIEDIINEGFIIVNKL